MKEKMEYLRIRIKDIMFLEDGWYNGEGKKYSPILLKLFSNILMAEMERRDIGYLVYLFPVPSEKPNILELSFFSDLSSSSQQMSYFFDLQNFTVHIDSLESEKHSFLEKTFWNSIFFRLSNEKYFPFHS